MGGKFRLRVVLQELAQHVNYTRVIDPFFGGGSTIHIFSNRSFLAGDANADLVNFHKVCRERPVELFEEATSFADDKPTYYELRARPTPTDPLDRAARFLYLNRTAYGGIYRVNRQGIFNVPYGGGGRLAVPGLKNTMINHASLLERGQLFAGHYSTVLGLAERGDLLFIDPPYAAPGRETFNRYGKDPFRSSDHKELSTMLMDKAASGVAVIATLPASVDVLMAYRGWRVVDQTVGNTLPGGEVVVVGGSSEWKHLGFKLPPRRSDMDGLLHNLFARST